MSWFVLALITAFLTAFSALLNKKAMVYWSAPLLILVSSVVVAVLLVSLSGGCSLSKPYFYCLPVSVCLHICASILDLKALKTGELSEVFPLISLSPLFMFITSPLIGGEFPRLVTIPGILLIVVGAYLLNFKNGSQGFWDPLKALWVSKAARYMMGVALLWSIAGNIDKLGVLNSSPNIWGASVKTGVAIYMLPASLLHMNKTKRLGRLAPHGQTQKRYLYLLLIPLVMALNLFCNMKAYELTLAINVVSVKRLSCLFSVLLAWFFLKEKNIRQRMGAAVLMVIGVLWVGFAP